MRKTILVSALSFALILVAKGQSVVTGKLVGADGKPMLKAHVHLAKPGQPKPLSSVEVDKNGRYKISTSEQGVLLVQYTGAHHGQYDLLLLADKALSANVDVRLATYNYGENFSAVKIMGDFNEFSFQTAKTMEKQPDGTYAAEFETTADKFRYQLFGIAESRSINGTQSEEFEYDEGGDYRSVVSPRNGKVRIVFDPNKLVRSKTVAEARFKDRRSTMAKVANLYDQVQARRRAFTNAVTAHRKSGKDMKEFKYEWTSDLASLAAQIKSEKDPIVRQVLLLAYIDIGGYGGKLEQKLAVQTLNEITPDSRLWSLNPFLIRVAGTSSGDKKRYDVYFEQFLEKHPDTNLKANLVFNELMSAKFRNDKESVKKYYDMLLTKFGDTPMAKMAKERINVDSNVEVGKTVPKFSFVSMEDPKKTYTSESFKGKVFLIDFWAVWCGPCVAEMENLHKAYDRFKTKNFEILSLSFDQKPEDVTKFRGDKWKMPWSHSFVEQGFGSPAAKDFEVIGIPKPILVDGTTGKILAMETDLRGLSLEKTLAKFLGEPE